MDRISISGFKSLYDIQFEPGNVNVFIGANGAGKSTILEAIGLLSLALTDRVDEMGLARKGIRLSVPALYRSGFKCLDDKPDIALSADLHKVHLYPLLDGSWECTSSAHGDNFTLSSFREYAIYQPITPVLRGTLPDSVQKIPLGLNGGRLAEAIEDVLSVDEYGDAKFGDIYVDELLDLIDWADSFFVTSPSKSNLSSYVATTRRVVAFCDRYMREAANFTAYDASEGSLFVLFLLCLALHPKAPSMFAVDNFDQAMNPRLVREVMRRFCNIIISRNKTVFLTTHNPSALDGLDLTDPRIRLFSVERNKRTGAVRVDRILVTEELIQKDMPLSRLWVNGWIGGVPNL